MTNEIAPLRQANEKYLLQTEEHMIQTSIQILNLTLPLDAGK
jgi:hypothetical protein